MKKILVLNSGSSSIKYELFRINDWSVITNGMVENIGDNSARLVARMMVDGKEMKKEKLLPEADHNQGFASIAKVLEDNDNTDDALIGIGHRVVHGGELFSEPTLITPEVMAAIRSLIPLAPLHNPVNLLGIEAGRARYPRVPQVAVFDTAFHQTMPDHASRYPLPGSLYSRYHIRRYGFHGTSHRYVCDRAAKFLGINPQALNLISLHLGGGASGCAVSGGRSVDTSMGFTPLEGLVMGSRCGDIDPAIIFYLQREATMSSNEVESLLNHESGLLGLCGSSDMREITARAEIGDKQAILALAIYAYRVKKYIGGYLAILGRCDALIFTGGIGENASQVREMICQGLAGLGIELDLEKNQTKISTIRDIAADASKIRILIIPTDEEQEIARQTLAVLEKTGRMDSSSRV
jgi:acetate kinase